MKGKRSKWLGYLLLAATLLVGIESEQVCAKEDIKRSDVKYEVNINDSQRVFIGNETPITYEVGRKYFLSYTVSEVETDETTQSGMIITKDKEEIYPYKKGGMKYDQQSLLLEEGYTYFFRFEIKENGLECIAAKAKGDKSEYIKLPHIAENPNTKGQYFGVWMAETGAVTGKLTNVRCYDENGKDLGVYGNETQGLVVLPEGGLQGNDAIAHSYSFSLKDADHVSISNLRATTSDVLYMEYTIKNVKYEDVTQSGVVMTNAPTAVYPYGSSGQMKYSPHKKPEECQLIEDGATYLYRITRNEEDFDVLVKRTVNGKTTYFSFPHVHGTYDSKCGYYTVWIGEHAGLTADFVDVKAYDAEGNNLAIQTNQGVEIMHHGNQEDYSECEAVYYCKENDTFISLDDECNASKRPDNESVSKMGTYFIRETTLSLTIGDDTEEFNYVYNWLLDKNGNKYIRLREQKVTLMSKAVDGEVIETIPITAEDGFKLAKPDEPTNGNHTFKGWVRGDGKEYDFDEVVTESFALYADWDGQPTFSTIEVLNAIPVKPVIAIASCILLALVTIVIICRIKRGGKHE